MCLCVCVCVRYTQGLSKEYLKFDLNVTLLESRDSGSDHEVRNSVTITASVRTQHQQSRVYELP